MKKIVVKAAHPKRITTEFRFRGCYTKETASRNSLINLEPMKARSDTVQYRVMTMRIQSHAHEEET
jgi:hypothetical protein